MERTAKDGHGVSENKAPERRSCKTIKMTKPQVLENVTRERAAAEVTPSTLSGTLHGNAFLKKMSATLHGSAHAESRRVTPRPPATPYPQTPRTTKQEPFARRAFGKKAAAVSV